jgi:integrase
MILAALRTGMRQGELRGLQWTSIDWQSGIITVRYSRCDFARDLLPPKSNRVRFIPVDRELLEALSKRRRDDGYVFQSDRGEPLTGRTIDNRLRATCRRAGLRAIGWHKLRHTFASELARRGVPLNAVQTLLGHSSITTTMRYAHVAPSTLRSAIDLLNPSRGGRQWQPAVNSEGQTENRVAPPAAKAPENPYTTS